MNNTNIFPFAYHHQSMPLLPPLITTITTSHCPTNHYHYCSPSITITIARPVSGQFATGHFAPGHFATGYLVTEQFVTRTICYYVISLPVYVVKVKHIDKWEIYLWNIPKPNQISYLVYYQIKTIASIYLKDEV